MSARAIAPRVRNFRQQFLVLIMEARGSMFSAYRRCQHAFCYREDRQERCLHFRFPFVVFSRARLNFVLVTRVLVILTIPWEPEEDNNGQRRRLKTFAYMRQVIGEIALRVRFRISIVAIAIVCRRMVPIFRRVRLVIRDHRGLRMVVQPIRALAVANEGSRRRSQLVQIVNRLVIAVVTVAMAMTVAVTAMTTVM